MKKRMKIAVAYSGGLDTSVMIKWLMDKFDAEIITVTGNIGQKKELNGVEAKALKTGATKAFVLDATKEFVEHYVFPALRAGALYEHAYPMATSLGRPLLAKLLVETALQENADAVAHGCERRADNHCDRQVGHMTSHHECLEFLKHAPVPADSSCF